MPTLDDIKARTTAHRRRDTWLKARKAGIGASEAAPVLGKSTFKTPLAIWAEKKGLAADQEQTGVMRRGHAMEELVAEEFQLAHPDVRLWNPGAYAITHMPGQPADASIDRFIIENEAQDVSILECKTPWKLSAWGDDLPDMQYWFQCQHQLMVTGCERAILALVVPTTWEYREYDIERHEKWQEYMLHAYQYFWSQLDTNDPNLELMPSDGKLLATIYPESAINSEKPEENTVVLDNEAMELDEEREELMGKLKEMKERKEIIDCTLKKKLGNHTVGLLPGVHYTWKTVTTQDRMTKGSTSRRLTRKELKG